jgi:hypothetical protein
MNEFLISHPFLCGIFFLFMGLIIIRYTYKNPPKKRTPIPHLHDVHLGGVLFVLVGIVEIIIGIKNLLS